MYRFMLLGFVVGCGRTALELEVRASVTNATSGYDLVEISSCVTDGQGVTDCADLPPVPAGSIGMGTGTDYAFIGDVFTVDLEAIDHEGDLYRWGPTDYTINGPVLEVGIVINDSHCCY